jgi:hypothetical protein
MSRGPSVFRKRDLTRALQGVLAADIPVARVEIADGKIVIITGKSDDEIGKVDLTPDDELERWRRQKNAR